MRLNICNPFQGIWFAFAATFFATTALATDITWTGSVSSDWNNSTNWSPQQIPTATDHVIISSGSVTVPASATFAVMDWSGGSISSSLTVASNAVLNLTGSGAKNIVALTNTGTVVWSGSGGLYAGNNASPYDGLIENLAGALWDIQSDSYLNPWFSGGNQYFRNAGTVRKSASTGTTSIDIPFYNTGTVEAQTGTITFHSGGTVEGVFDAVAGTTVTFSGGSFAYLMTPTLNGPGAFRFTGGSLTLVTNVIPNLQLVNGTVSLSPSFQGGFITNLSLNGSSLTGANTVSGTFNLGGGTVVGPLTVAGGGTLNWSAGSAGGSVTVASNGVLNVNGTSYVVLSSALTNAGTVNWLGGDFVARNSPCYNFYGQVENLAGGLWDIKTDQKLYNDWSPSYCEQPNLYFRNAGTVRKSAGNGTTTILIPFYNTGTVEAQTGTINFDSGYSGGSAANLAISLGGAAAGSGYGKINFSNPLSFDGTFTLSTRNGFLPNPGAAFQVLNYPSSTNSFACLRGLDLGGGILLQPQFSSTSLKLLAAAYTTNAGQPQLFINRTLGGLAITWPVGFPGWTLQSTTNLSSLAWISVSNACDNQALLPVTVPRQFFRLIQ